MKNLLRISALGASLLAGACRGSDEPATPPQTGDSPSHVGSADQLPEALPRFLPDEAWTVEAPSNAMRLHQYRLPGADGDGDAELVVAAWPSNLNGLEANLRRWIDQAGMALDVSELGPDRLEEREVRGFVLTTLALEGAEEAGGDEGAHGPTGTPMLVSYIEKPGYPGVWTVKVTGPWATIQAHRDAVQAFLDRL